jgi:hypothetical protein
MRLIACFLLASLCLGRADPRGGRPPLLFPALQARLVRKPDGGLALRLDPAGW